MEMSIGNANRNWTIYFDGLCPLCSREINHYRHQKGAERFTFTDITAPEFNPQAENLDPIQVHKVMHVRTPEGKIKTGVSAFLEIWSALPRYQWAYRMGSKALVFSVLSFFYAIFALLRPWLPRRTRGCESSPYCDNPSFDRKDKR